MPLIKPLCLVLSLFLPLASHAEVRHLETKRDQIIAVKTALGIATIIQVPDRPTSVVIGDQSAFKVEYLDKAITIKPLIPNAKTNLYIYTDWQRYNVKLVPTQKNLADYVVYLQPKIEKKKSVQINWKKFNNHLKNENLRLDVEKIGSTKNGLYLIDFNISANKNEKINPEWLWLTQNGRTVPIHRLFIDKLKLKSNEKTSGLILTRREDLSRTSPIRIELRRKRISYLTIKEPNRW